MKNFYCITFCLLSGLLFQQTPINFYKVYNSPLGTSAITGNTLTAKTYSFSHPVYKMIPDTLGGNLILSTRQKDASGKSYTNKGFHLALRKNDSACCVLEDNKLDIELSGEMLILSNDKRSGRFNRTFGYEQFEFPSKIIYTIAKNNSGLTYHSTTKPNEAPLSCVSLNDGTLLWSAAIPSASNWNDVVQLNDSVLIIAAGGLHAVNIYKGLLWTYPLTTSVKNDKPLTYSTFNRATYDKNHKGIVTMREEGIITQLSSSVLISGEAIYFAAKDRIIVLNKNGKLLWQYDLSSLPVSRSILHETKESIVLVNLGVAQYGDNIIQTGKPFVIAFNKQNGSVVLNMNDEFSGSLTDVSFYKNKVLIGDKSLVVQVTEDAKIIPLMNLLESKFGRLIEFVNGEDYYVEKEGFYVPLNFINDNVFYFKTDHGKVFGMNNGDIEYEYHFTELYKMNTRVGDKKLISQKNKSLLISSNFEMLYSFTVGENAVVLKDKIYFPQERLLHIINVSELK